MIFNIDVNWDANGEPDVQLIFLEVPVPCAAIGDRVWLDSNINGLQDAGEPGVAGVTVELRKCSDNSLVATMLTDASGNYLISSLNPGDYYVKVIAPGYVFTTQNVGANDGIDSDVDALGVMACTTLSAGETDLTWDAGIYLPKAAIGNFVWLDSNANGRQDAGEPGLGGVTMELYRCVVNILVTSMPTAADGSYLFGGLTPGDYYVKAVAPAGYTFTAQNAAGTTPANDSDANASTGVMACTTLAPGETDLTWDAGLIAPCVNLFDDYLIIGMKPRANGEAVTIGSSQEIGANRQTLSGDNPASEPYVSPVTPNISPAYPAPFSPDLRDVFFKDPSVPTNISKNRWIWDAATQSHYLPGAARLFRGVDWSGNVAVTSPTGSFSLQNINVFGSFGFRSTSTTAPVNISNSNYFAQNSLSGVAMSPIEGGGASQAARGWVGAFNHLPLLTELRNLRTLIRNLPKDADFHSGNAANPRDLVNRNSIDGGGVASGPNSKLVYDIDALDVNGDGYAVIDIVSDGTDFEVNNSDWIITDSNLANGTPFAIFRIRGGANMNMSQSSIMAGEGYGPTFSGLAAAFVKVHPEEEFTSTSGSSDSVFTANNLVINRIGFWDLNTIGDANTDTDYSGFVDRAVQNNYTLLSVNNGQGCGQFISGMVYMQNVRFVRCTECVDSHFAAAPPSPWVTRDIGTVSVSGSAVYTGSTFTLRGAGANIAGTADAFYYTYQPASGDCSIVARVTGVQNTAAAAKAGVMIRETLNANSRHVSMMLTPAGGTSYIYRTAAGGATTTATQAGPVAPYWLKVTRTGNAFQVSTSVNNVTWTVIGNVNVTMAANVFIGLGVTSGNAATLNTSTIDNVTATP